MNIIKPTMKEDTILVPVKASDELPPIDKYVDGFYIDSGNYKKWKVIDDNGVKKIEDFSGITYKIEYTKVIGWLKETTKSELLKQELEKVMPSEEEIGEKISDNIGNFVYKQYRVDKFDYTKGFKDAIIFIKQFLTHPDKEENNK